MRAGVELADRCDTHKEKVASFLDAITNHGHAEVQEDKPPRIPIRRWQSWRRNRREIWRGGVADGLVPTAWHLQRLLW